MTCLVVGVARKMSWTSRRISVIGKSLAKKNPPATREWWNPTDLIQHFITFVKAENFNAAQSKFLVSYQSVHSPGCTNDNMRMCVFAGQSLDIFLHRGSTIKNGSLHLRHVLAKSCVLVLDLVSKLAGMTHYQDGAFAGNWFDLLKSSENKNSRLPEA